MEGKVRKRDGVDCLERKWMEVSVVRRSLMRVTREEVTPDESGMRI